jgi:2',3'-cyclic-nucleotide 2'-phosphodiesterase (5'-nucleotidase family)
MKTGSFVLPSLLLLAACSVPLSTPAPARPQVLRVISTNDFHGAFEPRLEGGRMLGGAAYLVAAISRAAGECAPSCATILLDGGDMFQGTPASNLAFGRPVVELYNEVGYAAAALGNHEFDWTQDTLRARMRQARFSILGANVTYADGSDVPWIPNDTIITRSGVRIGVIGISTPQTPHTTRTENVADLRFQPAAPVVDAHARSLRGRGAEVILVVAHEGAFCAAGGAPASCNGEIVDLARSITEKVHGIVSGHTHSALSTVINGIPIIQARSSGRAIAVLDIPLRNDGEVRLEVRTVAVDSLQPNQLAQRIAERALTSVASIVNRPIAGIAEPMRRLDGQYALGNLIADAMRAAGSADIGIMNNGGIRADLPAGTATYGRLFEVQPFANTLVRVTLDGRQLTEYLERVTLSERQGRPNVHVSGVRIRYDGSRPVGSRIQEVLVGTRGAIRDDDRYTVVINDFMLTGGDNLSPPKEGKIEWLNLDLDATISYLSRLPQPVTPPGDVRIVRVTQ